MKTKTSAAGYISAAAAYILWGALPLYWKAASEASPLEILAHRILWSFVLLTIVDFIRSRGKAFASIRTGKTFLAVLLTGSLIAVNWFVYIFAVNSGFIVEASLGYYINPIVSVLLGVIFLRERLDIMKKAALFLAACGVVFVTVNIGKFPWISLVLAISFGLYGLFKKLFALDSLSSLLMETMLLLPPALFIIIRAGVTGRGHLFAGNTSLTLLLVFSGLVTSVPLVLFAEGARRIPLSSIGFLQYFSPTITLILGVFLYGESFTTMHLVAFCLIWAGLVLYTVSAFIKREQKA